MDNNKEKIRVGISKKINAEIIKMIHPKRYELFYELLEKEAENNEMLKKNLAYIEKILDLMKTMDRKSEEKDIICLVCESLVRGLDIDTAIDTAICTRREQYYPKLMNTKIIAGDDFLVRKEIYNATRKADSEIIERIKRIKDNILSNAYNKENLVDSIIRRNINLLPKFTKRRWYRRKYWLRK